MSVWSRSHSDLAKLAKTLQQSNDRAKQRLGQRHAPDGDGRLRRTRSLSPGILSWKEDTDSVVSVDGKNGLTNTSSIGSPVTSPLSHGFTVPTKQVSGEGERAKSGSESSGMPLITVTSQENGDEVVSETVCFYTEDNSDSVFDRLNSSESNVSTPDSVLVQPFADDLSRTEISGSSPVSSSQSLLLTSVKATLASPKKDPARRIQSDPSSLSETVKGGPNGLRLQSPDLLKTQATGVVNGTPLSPRLSTRSPDLLRKLKEVSISLGFGKAERARKRGNNTRTALSEHRQESLPSYKSLEHDTAQRSMDTVPDECDSPGLRSCETAEENGEKVNTKGANGCETNDNVEISRNDVSLPVDAGELSLPSSLQQTAVSPVYSESAPDSKGTKVLSRSTWPVLCDPSQVSNDSLPVVNVSLSAASNIEQSNDSSSFFTSPVSSPAQLRICDVDLRLVPLSAIGIVVGTKGDLYGFQQGVPQPQNGPRIPPAQKTNSGDVAVKRVQSPNNTSQDETVSSCAPVPNVANDTGVREDSPQENSSSSGADLPTEPVVDSPNVKSPYVLPAEQISPNDTSNSDAEQTIDSQPQEDTIQHDNEKSQDTSTLEISMLSHRDNDESDAKSKENEELNKPHSAGQDVAGLPAEDKSLRSSSSGIEADCRHSPSPPDPHADSESESRDQAEERPDVSGIMFRFDNIDTSGERGNAAGRDSSRVLMTSGSSVFPASPSSLRCIHCHNNSRDLTTSGSSVFPASPCSLRCLHCHHNHSHRYTLGYSGSGEDDLDTVSEVGSKRYSSPSLWKESPVSGFGRLSVNPHFRSKSPLLYTDRSDMKESLTLSRSDLCESGTESDRSAVSASVQVTLTDVSERSRWSSRPPRRRARDRDERSDREDVSSGHRTKRSERRTYRHKSDRHSDRRSDERVATRDESSRSWSTSSADSLLSVSDTGSSCAAEVWQYLTSSSSKQGEGQRHINKRRLKRFLKHLQHSSDSALQGEAGLSEFNKTVAELQELCVSLSRHLEQQRQQQQYEHLQQEQKHLEQLQKLHQQHREQLQQLQQQQLQQQELQKQQVLRKQQEPVPEAKETRDQVLIGKKTSFLSVRLHQRSPVSEIPHLPTRTSPRQYERISLAELKAQVAIDLDQALLWEDYIERELLGHERLETDEGEKEPSTDRTSVHGLDVPESVGEDLQTPSESEEAPSSRPEGEASEKASVGEEVCEGEESEMETPEEAVMKLDEEFDKLLVDMKPHVLQLPHRADRQKCAVWIKKLCEPPSSGITGRKNRNMYAQLMLHMLKRGNIQGPFDKKPEEGPLHPLPPYMSIYFDEPLDKEDGENEKLPDWVEGELADTIGSSVFRRTDTHGNPAATSTWVSQAGSSLRSTRQRPHTSMGISLDKDPGLSPIRGDFNRNRGYSADDLTMDSRRSPPPALSPSDRERRQLPDVKRTRSPESRVREQTEDWSRPLGVSTASTTASFGKTGLFGDDTSLAKPSDKEIAVRTKMIEAKFHEEKLRLQQKHDAAVQKILDRKNSEIEDVKSHYRSKTKELEETITKLERKVHTLVKEASVVRETRDKQITELKKMVEATSESQRNEYEKRLHDMEADFEQQKFELQKLHTRNIQEILDDTNARLQRMEAEYNQQAASTTSIIKELESRVQHLTGEVDHTLSQRTILEKEKSELQSRLERNISELEMAQERAMQLEREHQKRQETSEHEMRTLRNKTEASLEFLKQEHSIAAAKAADSILDLEQQVDYLKKALKDAEEHRQRQMRETEQVHQQDKLHLENLHDKQVRSMKKELEQLEQEMQRKVSRLEQLLKDKEAEVQKQKELAKEQAQQAEKALEEFKQQVEKNQNQIYAEMKQQMEQVESDLKKSKQSREKQNREFTRQLEDEKYKHEHEMAEAKMTFEQEKAQLLHEVHVQKEYATSEHERDMEQLREMHRNEMKSLEFRYKEKQEKDSKVIGELEAQVTELREELVQANQLRKQQLVELGLLREEEKQKMQRDHEAESARYRTDAEQQRLELQKMHSAETEHLLEKTNDRLKSIEREYTERGKKSAETITELQSTIKQLREDIKRVKENADSRISEMRGQFEEERQSLKKQYSSNLAIVQHELESQRNRCHSMERQLQRMEADHEEKITHLKLEHEERMRGLLPAEMKQELEDTIGSLKSQVNTLQQRAAMLQEELDLRLKNPLGPFGSRTSSPIKSSV